MARACSREQLDFMYHHVFLPSQLPHAAEDEEERPKLETSLLEMTIESLRRYRQRCPLKDRVSARRAIKGLEDALAIHTTSTRDVNEDDLAAWLAATAKDRSDATLPLYIRSQNAGVVVRWNDELILETFELSATNQMVTGTIGSLSRSFPASAVLIDHKHSTQKGFQTTVAQTLAAMAREPAGEMQPQIQKAGRSHNELRDTVNPSVVTSLFSSAFLKSLGAQKDVPTVLKRTRDEILWHDSLSPWRRAPIWLLIRVFLQLTFRQGGSPLGYKMFMPCLMGDILSAIERHAPPDAVLYAMSAKISRRLVKLGTPLPDQLLEPLRTILLHSSRTLEERWTAAQELEQPLDTAVLQHLNLKDDRLVKIPELERYLEAISSRTSKDRATSFVPNGHLLQLSSSRWPDLPASFQAYDVANLNAVEYWVQTQLRRCMNFYNTHVACQEAYSLLKQYHRLASTVYANNPEMMSSMILTLMEIWVRCDERAIAGCDLLSDYDHEIPLDGFQNLILPSRIQMERLASIERYLKGRSQASNSLSIYEDPSKDYCFPVRFFDRGTCHQELLEQIEGMAEERKTEKLDELKAAKERRNHLKDRAEKEPHGERELLQKDKFGRVISTKKVHDDDGCRKCKLMKAANNIWIDVYEWPLPADATKAKAVVFELNPPEWFAAWRDCTAYLVKDVLKAQYTKLKQVARPWVLKDAGQLRWAYKQRAMEKAGSSSDRSDSDESNEWSSEDDSEEIAAVEERIVMASRTKPFLLSHYKTVQVTDGVSDQNVIVASGGRYDYFDLDCKVFVSVHEPTELMVQACTYQTSESLQRYFYRTKTGPDGEVPNTGIAAQSACPGNMTFDEYLELGSMAYGHSLQWWHIAMQLHAPGVDMRKTETALMFLQCAYQTGPASDEHNSVLRSSHHITRDPYLQECISAALGRCLDRVKQNWESTNVILILSSIATRLISLCPEQSIREDCMAFLVRCRTVAAEWLQTLRAKMQSASVGAARTEFVEKCIEVACILMITFDLDLSDLAMTFSSREQASLFLQCSISLSELAGGPGPKPGSLIALLKVRCQRILYRSHTIFESKEMQQALDDAVGKSWAAYRPSFGQWKKVWGNWLTKPVTSVRGDAMDVHYDLLSGDLLVNGEKLKRTPKAYEAHPLYAALFGNVGLEVMESRSPGMRFSVKKAHRGFTVNLNLKRGCDLIVQAFKENEAYEILPDRIFKDIFPEAFVNDFVHWYNEAEGSVEFRPKHSPWSTNASETWILSRAGQGYHWRLSRDSTSIVASCNATSRHISQLLSPLIAARRIHVLLDASGSRVDVDLPSLQLGFSLLRGTDQLVSKEFRGKAVDANQQLGSLVGFSSKLCLRDTRTGNRMALIPEGPISYQAVGNHVSVAVDQDSVSKVHPIQVDKRLQRLVDNGSMQCKLFLAYLHALTSSCLPDPLIRKSGTEQALSILTSAAVRSFDQLTDENVQLLTLIARLTPGRAHYPKDENLMQTVTWDPELSCFSQHGWFYKVVKTIFLQAKRSGIFHPHMPLKLPVLDHVVESLLRRDDIRASVFRIADYGAEDHTSRHDVDYNPDHRDQHNAASANAFKLCLTVEKGLDGLVWKAPTLEKLWSTLASVLVVPGPHSELDMLRYDPSLLSDSEVSGLQHLLALHSCIKEARNGDSSFNKYAFKVWLATLGFSSRVKMESLQIIAALWSSSVLHCLSIPDVEYCSPAEGRTAVGKEPFETLIELVVECAVDYVNSSEYRAPANPVKTRKQDDEAKRARYENKKRTAAREFVKVMQKQWPTKTPVLPEKPLPASITNYIVVEQALEAVKPKFQTWWNNVQLYSYLEDLASILSGLSPITIGVSTQALEVNVPAQLAQQRCILVDHLFAGPAPCERPRPSLASSLTVDDYGRSLSTVAPDTSLLGKLIEDMQRTARDFESRYLQHLQESLALLQKRGAPPCNNLPTFAQIQAHLDQCERDAQVLYDTIRGAMRDNQKAMVGHTDPWHSPRVSPMLLLEQLSRRRWCRLSDEWKGLLVAYGLALTACQRAERLLHSTNQIHRAKELQNVGHSNWKPVDHPESLLLEIESGLLIREVQEEVAANMREPPGNLNSCLLLNMGEGKSSVLVPIVASALADGSQLVRVVVAKPQSKQMAQMLQSKLGGLLNRRIYHMPFSRAVEPTRYMAQAIQNICSECVSEGGIMLVQPEHLLSFKLMGIECYISAGLQDTTQAALHAEVGQQLIKTQDFLEHNTRDIVDESDEIFSVKFELVYTMGIPRDIELAPSRWQHIQEILGLARVFSEQIHKDRPSALEITEHGKFPNCFPRIRILELDAGNLLVGLIAREICDHGSLDFKVDEAVKDIVFDYITKFELSNEEIAAVENSSFWQANQTTLLLLRGLLATGVLAFSLGQKRYRVNYGLTERLPKTRLAVPYRAKDSPTPRSEYSHQDVVIILTSLSHYYEGLKDDDLFLVFGFLLKSDNASANYEAWIRGVDIPEEFRDLSGINLRDRSTCISRIFPPLRYAKNVVDYFLSNVVFKKELKEYPSKLSTSGWDIAKSKRHPTTGFSGTNDSSVTLPQSMQHLDLESQRHTNALVLDYLLRPENTVALMPQVVAPLSDAERLLNMTLAMRPSPQVILDVGAQILELNEDVASRWLRSCLDPHKEAAVFCNEVDELMVVDRRGIKEPLQTSSYSTRLDSCLVYLDEAHTRGIDLKLPQYSCAAVTLGAHLTKDTLVQACMRMRELGKGQTVVFCVSAEIEAKIRACAINKPAGTPLGVDDVLRWTMNETFANIRRSMPLWAMQGFNFTLQQEIWNPIVSDGKTSLTPKYAERFLEPEAKTIASRYRPGNRFVTALDKLIKTGKPKFMQLAHRCREFDNLQTNTRRFQEESERELLAEQEEERVVESTLPAMAATHRLSPALVRLVKVGRLLDKNGRDHFPQSTFLPAFRSLANTTVAAELDVESLVPDVALLATQDFATTIQDVDSDGTQDSFQRPVRWILTIRPFGGDTAIIVVLISPFEAQGLLGDVKISPFASLHYYKPRCNLAYRPTDELNFMTISNVRVKISIPIRLRVQIHVFAGTLYFDSYDEYVETCKFLGLASEPAKKGWVVNPDGFIQRDGNGRKGGESALDRSPIKFLKALLTKVRRTGQDIGATHMGRLLEGRLLSKEEIDGAR